MSAAGNPNQADSKSPTQTDLRLEIGPVVARAEEISRFVDAELPGHVGLARAAQGVAAAAHEADRVSRRLRRPFGWHRLPAVFLALSLLLFAGWIYWQFFYNSRLVIAVSSVDAIQLRDRAAHRVRIETVPTLGSQASIAMLRSGEADLAFVQGGVELPDSLIRTELEGDELVLFFLRRQLEGPAQIKTILTSSEGQGSHSLARVFCRIWGIENQVEFVHTWRQLTDDADMQVDDAVDAVLVVKDPLSSKLDGVAQRLDGAGFRLFQPDVGAMGLRLPYLSEAEVRPGFLDPVAHLPVETVPTYAVATYLVARPDLTPRQMAAAGRLLTTTNRFDQSGLSPSLDTANEVAQGVEAVLGIVVYIGLAFLALLGLDIVAYRKRFNDLNSLVSLVSMHQSSKDIIGCPEDRRAHNIAYLSVCSDLLGLIAVITGYYTQENSSLLYNRLLEIIHERCSGLKINIQLKILHSTIDVSTWKPDGNST